jgi:hypothetical protein
MLQQPGSRAVLLDPDVDEIALGALQGSEPGLAAIVGSYAFLDDGSLDDVASRLRERLTRERAARGQDAPEALAGVDALAMDAAARVRGGAPGDAELEGLLAASSKQLQRGVSGFASEVSHPDHVVFPEPLLTEPRLGVAFGVSAHRPEGSPWGRWVVFVVAAPSGAIEL